MPDATQLVVRSVVSGATAQLRSVIEIADREEARRIHAELHRIAIRLEVKYEFGKGLKKLSSLVHNNP